jgi:integrase
VSKYRRNGWWTVRVPHPDSGVVEKSIGSQEGALASRYETMCAVLMERPVDHVFLDRVCSGSLPIRKLYKHWSTGTLATLRAEIVDTDLTAYLADWRKQLVTWYGEPVGKPGCSSHTVTQYTKQVGDFFAWAGGATLAQYTVARTSKWLYSRDVSSARKRRFWAALRSFGLYLQSVGILSAETQPLAGLKAPPAGKARDTHLTPAERDQLIAAVDGIEMQAAETLGHLGMEMGAIVRSKVRDVVWVQNPRFAGRIRMRGTKNRFRDRIGIIEHWAAEKIREAMKGKHPDALLIGVGHSKIRAAHQEACEALGLTGYRFHDGRHTFAVEWWSRGAPSSVIGLQLGHADGRTVEKVYGQSKVSTQQLEHWAGVVSGTAESATKPATSVSRHGP